MKKAWIQKLKSFGWDFISEHRDREQAIALSKLGIIYGDDAKRFHQRMKEVEEGKHKVPKEERERMKASYEAMKSISKFKL